MKRLILTIIAANLMLLAGCQEQARNDGTNTARVSGKTDSKPAKACFEPVSIRLVGLTEIIVDSDGKQKLKAYIDLLDHFECRIKYHGIFRLELYTRQTLSAEIKGKRIAIWGDFDLTEAKTNNAHWQDYLRCYHFELQMDSQVGRGSYLLEATFIRPDQKRLSDIYEIEYPK